MATITDSTEVRCITIRVPADLLAVIDRRAAKGRKSRESWIRGVLSEWTRVKDVRDGHASHRRARQVLADSSR